MEIELNLLIFLNDRLDVVDAMTRFRGVTIHEYLLVNPFKHMSWYVITSTLIWVKPVAPQHTVCYVMRY